LPQKKLKIDFSEFVKLPADFATWLDRLLEPEPNRRFETAKLALDVLNGRSSLPALPTQQPAFSKIRLDRFAESLSIEIPPVGLSTVASRRLGLLVFIWNGLLFTILFYALTLSLFLDPTKQLFFVGFGLVGLWLMVKLAYGTLERVNIYFDTEGILISKQIFGREYDRQKLTIVRDLTTSAAFSIVPFTRSLQFDRSIQLHNRGKKYPLAQLLSLAENMWLKSEIDRYLVSIAAAVENRLN
jgi:eukaryotic-like serine/threonine-protein kinase